MLLHWATGQASWSAMQAKLDCAVDILVHDSTMRAQMVSLEYANQAGCCLAYNVCSGDCENKVAKSNAIEQIPCEFVAQALFHRRLVSHSAS